MHKALRWFLLAIAFFLCTLGPQIAPMMGVVALAIGVLFLADDFRSSSKSDNSGKNL